jgi:carbon-monoxide dehydrogenase medium subunit
MEIAVVGAAALVTLDGAGRIAAARVALTAVAPTVVRAFAAEAALAGAAAGPDAYRAAGEAAAVPDAGASPISDVRASAEYRRAMLAVVVARTVAAACARASGGVAAVPVPASRWLPGEGL